MGCNLGRFFAGWCRQSLREKANQDQLIMWFDLPIHSTPFSKKASATLKTETKCLRQNSLCKTIHILRLGSPDVLLEEIRRLCCWLQGLEDCVQFPWANIHAGAHLSQSSIQHHSTRVAIQILDTGHPTTKDTKAYGLAESICGGLSRPLRLWIRCQLGHDTGDLSGHHGSPWVTMGHHGSPWVTRFRPLELCWGLLLQESAAEKVSCPDKEVIWIDPEMQSTLSNLARLWIFAGHRMEIQDLSSGFRPSKSSNIFEIIEHHRIIKTYASQGPWIEIQAKKRTGPNLLAGNVIHKRAQQCGSFSLDLSGSPLRPSLIDFETSLRAGQSGLDLPDRSARPATSGGPSDVRASLWTMWPSLGMFGMNCQPVLCRYCSIWWDLMRSGQSDKIRKQLLTPPKPYLLFLKSADSWQYQYHSVPVAWKVCEELTRSICHTEHVSSWHDRSSFQRLEGKSQNLHLSFQGQIVCLDYPQAVCSKAAVLRCFVLQPISLANNSKLNRSMAASCPCYHRKWSEKGKASALATPEPAEVAIATQNGVIIAHRMGHLGMLKLQSNHWVFRGSVVSCHTVPKCRSSMYGDHQQTPVCGLCHLVQISPVWSLPVRPPDPGSTALRFVGFWPSSISTIWLAKLWTQSDTCKLQATQLHATTMSSQLVETVSGSHTSHCQLSRGAFLLSCGFGSASRDAGQDANPRQIPNRSWRPCWSLLVLIVTFGGTEIQPLGKAGWSVHPATHPPGSEAAALAAAPGGLSG